MLIVGLVIAILIAAGLVFVFIKSVVAKLISIVLVVLTLVNVENILISIDVPKQNFVGTMFYARFSKANTVT